MIGGNNDKEAGSTVIWGINGCGPDCIHLSTSGAGVDMRRDGPFWTGVGADGCKWSLMNDSLYVNANCPGGATFIIAMTPI